ncbi:DUF4097 domain-containing protein [bacterium]|nr:DUF4097 domain-containing protein [bacterium]
MKFHRYVHDFLLLFIFGSVSVVWSIERKQVEEKYFSMPSGRSITLTANEGNITVHSWEREEVVLEMTKRAWGEDSLEAERLLDAIEVEIREEMDQLVIRELDFKEREDRFHFFDLFDSDFWREQGQRNSLVDFELTIPRNVHLRLRCDEGDVDLSGTQGKLDIDVDEGSVHIENIISEEIRISADEGDVRIQQAQDEDQGLIKIEMDEGSIWFENGQIGEIDFTTDEGEIVIDHIELNQCWLNTDEGDIEVSFLPVKDGRYRMETDEGDVELSLPEDVNLHIALITGEGRIESDFDMNIQRRQEAERVEETIGREEGTLRIYTGEGYIRLRKR